MAKLKAVLTAEEYAALSDLQKENYAVGEDGKAYLDLDGIDDHAAVRGMRNAMQRLKADEAKLKKQLGTLPEGITPEEIAALVQERAQREEEKKKAAGAWDDLKEQLLEQQAAKDAAAQKKIAARETFIRKLVVENNAISALTEAGATKTGVRLLLPHVMASLEAVAVEDGEAFSMQVAVRGSDGKPRLSPAGTGAPMELAEFVKEMRGSEDFAVAFSGTQSGGSGASQSSTPGAGGVRTLSDLKTPADKAAFIGKHGLDAFNALLPAEAVVFGPPKA